MTHAKKDHKSAAGRFGFGTQIRKSPYFDATVRWGANGFSVYNHMYIPRDFGDPVQNFWNLVNTATLSDVAVERQVEISGPDGLLPEPVGETDAGRRRNRSQGPSLGARELGRRVADLHEDSPVLAVGGVGELAQRRDQVVAVEADFSAK